MRRPSRLLLVLATAALASPLGAQEWRAGVQFGRIASDAAPATGAGASSLALALTRAGTADWFGVTGGVPLSEQPFWGVAAAWKRWQSAPVTGLGVDVNAHAFLQRERAPEGSDFPLDPLDRASATLSGEGAGGEATALAFTRVGSARIELGAGAAAQSSSVAGIASSALLPLASARVSGGVGAVRLAADARQWFGDTAHAFANISAQLQAGPVDLWASAGSWLRGGQDAAEFSAGASWTPVRALRVEAGYRAPGFDPLYGTLTPHTFSVGASVHLGGRTGMRAPIPASYENGRALIRIGAGEARGTPRIAGDFTDWKPRAMTRSGNSWTFTIPLQPGVYHYAFVNERDEWFVPESLPGRQSDGMGGHVAVLVVAE